MADRNTGIRSSQIKNLTIQTEDLKDGNVTGVKLNADVVDDFTMKLSNDKLKIADRIELNTMLNAFRIAINGSLSQFNMVDGITDEYEDETGIDTGASTNQDYDSGNDLYKPTSIAALELDYMEYATDGAAQTAYVSSSLGLPSSEYSSDSYTKLLLHLNNNVTDSGETGHTIINEGVTFDDGVKKFGSHSAYFDSSANYLKVPTHADLDFGTGNFTVDFQFKADSIGDNGLFDLVASTDEPLDIFLTATNKLAYRVAGQTHQESFTDTTSWHHVALVRDSTTTVKCFLDGILIHTFTIDSATTFDDNGQGTWFGTYYSPAYDFDGYMDEIRISKGIARWTSDFDVINLQSYSENTIVNQGTYSLKAIAAITDSLNETLTKSGLSLNLTDKDTLKLWAYSSRTGTNLQIQIHDSGGQTSTKDIVISSATTWTEITWDISGISNANKDDIDSIIIKIINADSANTFYIDNFYAPGATNNMTLISNSETAEAQPDTARIIIFEEDVDSVTENTDIKTYITRDGGTTHSQVTLSDEGDYQSGKRILTGTVDISGQPAGTSMEYKIETLNNKSLKLHGVGILWD